MSALHWILSAQALIALAALLALASGRNRPAGQQLRAHYLLAAALFAILLCQSLVTVPSTFRPFARPAAADREEAPAVVAMAREPAPAPRPHPGARLDLAAAPRDLGLAILVLFAGLAGGWLVRDLRRLHRLRARTYLLRRLGNVEIRASETINVPFSCWLPGRSLVVVPVTMLARPEEYRIAVLHELQHHRQRDPQWMIALEVLRLFCWLNPPARAWVRRIHELQEFAVDEALVDRSRVNSRQYARCLLQAAQSALQPGATPACATGLIFRVERKQLKRRIMMLLDETRKQNRSKSKLALRLQVAVITAVLATGAFAAKVVAQEQRDRVITMEEARELASRVPEGVGIRLEIDAAVVKALNGFADRPSSRRDFKAALLRMNEEFAPVVDPMLRKYQLPTAVRAIPLIESSYQNLPEKPGPENGPRGAGLWMFIPGTARRMGVAVDHRPRGQRRVDERMDVEKLTDAAGRLLRGNHLLYNDLGLSILTYAWGEKRVEQLMASTGSRDPWALARAYPEQPYLAELTAAILIAANPKLVE